MKSRTLEKVPVEKNIRKKLPNNPRTFRLFPLESFTDHPTAWLKWMNNTNYQVTNKELKAAITVFFKKRESRYEFRRFS